MPERIQLSRRKGWRKPENTVVVARPSKWGNPFRVGKPDPLDGHLITSRAEAVERYRLHAGARGAFELDVDEVRRELAGKNLACWCSLPADGEPDICHAAVLLEIANG
jgi:hypothetical protein